LWKPAQIEAARIEEKVQLPKLLYLPAPVALYAMEGNPKTAIELYNFVKEHITNSPTANVSITDADMVLKWLLAAGQVEPGKQGNKSAVAMAPQPVFETAQAFVSWAKQKMVNYLGEDSQEQHSPGGTSGGHIGVNTAEYVREMTSAVKDLAKQQGEWQQHVKQPRVENSKMLDDFDMAALKAYCGVATAGEVPAFWALSRMAKSTDAARSNLMKEMEKWSDSTFTSRMNK
jgi:hypothetical protein